MTHSATASHVVDDVVIVLKVSLTKRNTVMLLGWSRGVTGKSKHLAANDVVMHFDLMSSCSYAVDAGRRLFQSRSYHWRIECQAGILASHAQRGFHPRVFEPGMGEMR